MTDSYTVVSDDSVFWRDLMTLEEARNKAIRRTNAERKVFRVVLVAAVEYAEPRDAELFLQPTEESRP